MIAFIIASFALIKTCGSCRITQSRRLRQFVPRLPYSAEMTHSSGWENSRFSTGAAGGGSPGGAG
jgi:hypothetical protein